MIRAVRTPPKEEQKEDNVSPAKLASLDEEWITTHASQVPRGKLTEGMGQTERE